MTASSVSICSNALLMLGAQPINSFDEASGNGALDRARLCSNLYAQVRDEMLREHPWNCATKRVVLSPSVDAPAFDYAYAFALPGDWLRTLQVGEEGLPQDFKSESGFLLADTSLLKLRYIWRNETEASWDSLLVDAVTYAMAARMAYAITASSSQQDAMEQKLERVLRKARAVDGQDEPPQTFGDFRLLGARYSGRAGGGLY